MKKFISSLGCMTFGALLSASAAGEGIVIDTDTTGNWFNPDQPGYGLQIEVLDRNRAVIAWFTFDSDGNPVWLFGSGRTEGAIVSMELQRFKTPGFPPFDREDLQRELWGTIEFELLGCNEANLRWAPEAPDFMPGESPLRRLTKIDGHRCGEQASFDRTFAFLLDRGPLEFEAQIFPSSDLEFLEFGHEPLPPPLSARSGLKISGPGPSSMRLIAPLAGLEPETTYRLEMEVQFATDLPSGCVGLGGSPDGAMGLGAADQRPDPDNQIENRVIVGDLTNGLSDAYCPNPSRPWILKRLSTRGQALEATTNADGVLWVYAVFLASAESRRTWYLTELIVRLADDPQGGQETSG
ncbi:MAG: hypothetical protein RQ847_09940 [Wenzhouxiangellaceae bacterium]|nr:hypothetical protein [Wenzhouxiangellaceae bacterium]